MGASLILLAALSARESADITPRGHWSVGLLDPLRVGVSESVEVNTHPIIDLLLSPNLETRVAFRTGKLRVTGEYGLSVPTFAMRLTKGFLIPEWKTSDNRLGWFVVPSVGLAVSAGIWTGRLDSAIGVPLGRNDAQPLDTWAPIELIFAPALNRYRQHAGMILDQPATSWLRVRGALDAWMIGPFDPPKSQMIYAASLGADVALGKHFRLALGGILYNSDQRRQVVECAPRCQRKNVRSWDVYPTVDLIFAQ